MEKQKPVSYPNLVESMNAVVDAHTAMHDQVSNHAETHDRYLAQKRKSIEIQQVAHQLHTQGGEA